MRQDVRQAIGDAGSNPAPATIPGGVVELAQTPSPAALTLRFSLQTEHVPPSIKSTVGVLHRWDCRFKSGPRAPLRRL